MTYCYCPWCEQAIDGLWTPCAYTVKNGLIVDYPLLKPPVPTDLSDGLYAKCPRCQESFIIKLVDSVMNVRPL